jgi:hypothetical protein
MKNQQQQTTSEPEMMPNTGVDKTVPLEATWEFTEEEKSRIRIEMFLRDIDRQTNTELGIMGIRWQIWTGAVTLVSLLSVIAAPAPEGYAVGIAPWLLAYTAQYAGSGEGALKIIRKFFHFAAEQVGYTGISYEAFYDSFVRPDHGGGRQGLRSTLLLCQSTIAMLIIMRWWQDLFAFLPSRCGLLPTLAAGTIGTLIIAIVEGCAMCKTWWWLREPPNPQLKRAGQSESE